MTKTYKQNKKNKLNKTKKICPISLKPFEKKFSESLALKEKKSFQD